MTLEERNKMIETMFDSCKKALNRKGRDYSVDGDANAEWSEEAADIKSTPEKVIWIHLKKHLIAIRNAVNGETMQGDVLREHCQDAANYLFLLCTFIELKEGAGRAIPIEKLVAKT